MSRNRAAAPLPDAPWTDSKSRAAQKSLYNAHPD
ncbi:hypothetical protein sce0628 [Sorangium cellulosum So ce56]|uniref:Uncharacterized protein n=1 Tax=Sorangium cellulosum (strain So ce56) TaxID=448385 RepID=A9GVP0_SORC5|nr:hypothetical protein sce0628 [Sorangium cellulosum So ce56]